MKKKPAKTTKTRTNWKQKYEELDKGYERFVRENAHTRLQLSTTLEHLQLERGVTDRMEREKKALEVKNTQLHTTIKQLEHTLTILTQTGIATKEQCEIARRLAETIVKNEPTPDEKPSRLKSALTGALQGLGGAVAGSKAHELYPTDRHIASV